MGTPEHLTATAMDINTGRSSGVEIDVTRWSTDTERERLLSVLYELGPEKLLNTLRDLPKVGGIRTFNSLAWDLHYARHAPLPDGGERVVIATDRPVSFREAAQLNTVA
jgi:hypothetical protein